MKYKILFPLKSKIHSHFVWWKQKFDWKHLNFILNNTDTLQQYVIEIFQMTLQFKNPLLSWHILELLCGPSPRLCEPPPRSMTVIVPIQCPVKLYLRGHKTISCVTRVVQFLPSVRNHGQLMLNSLHSKQWVICGGWHSQAIMGPVADKKIRAWTRYILK